MKTTSLTTMDWLENRTFKKELAESSGCVRIFIHPCCPTLSQTSFNRAPLEYTDGITIEPLRFLKKISTTKALKKTPIIVFEDRGNMWDFNNFLKDIRLTRNLYLIETESEDPCPKVGWERIRKILRKIGVKKIIIGGIYLYEYGGDVYRKNYPAMTVRGCVHGAGVELSKEFEIKISHFVNPGPSSVYSQYCDKFSPADHLRENILEA